MNDNYDETARKIIEGFEALQVDQKKWAEYNFGVSSDFTESFLGVTEELGELAHALLKQKQGIRGTYEEHEANGKDALVDMMVFMFQLANRKGWDLGETMAVVWGEVRKRDWRKFPRNGKTE